MLTCLPVTQWTARASCAWTAGDRWQQHHTVRTMSQNAIDTRAFSYLNTAWYRVSWIFACLYPLPCLSKFRLTHSIMGTRVQCRVLCTRVTRHERYHCNRRLISKTLFIILKGLCYYSLFQFRSCSIDGVV